MILNVLPPGVIWNKVTVYQEGLLASDLPAEAPARRRGCEPAGGRLMEEVLGPVLMLSGLGPPWL